MSNDEKQTETEDASSADAFDLLQAQLDDLHQSSEKNLADAKRIMADTERLYNENVAKLNRFQISLTDSNHTGYGFSADYLSRTVIPYIDAMIQIQHALDEALRRPTSDITILGIQYGSVTVDITGGIRDTAQLFLDNIVPWRRRTERKRAELSVKEIEIELKTKNLEYQNAIADQKRNERKAYRVLKQDDAEIEKSNVESQKIEAESRLLLTQAEEQALGNQKIRLEIVESTFDMLEKNYRI